jgi:integrating conjugative element protein (TIGR03746 family)
MSRFKNEIAHLQEHVRTLRLAGAALLFLTLLLAIGWWSAPRDLTIHVPPDLRSGSVRRWWDVPPESVYAFTLYIFQQLHRWPTNGDDDYVRNIGALRAYLTPTCKSFLEQDYTLKRDGGELHQRVRGIYEIPGRGYADAPAFRVQTLSAHEWIVTLDVSVDEFYSGEQVKRAFVRYPLKVVRLDVDPEKNPYGLALDCFARPPERIEKVDAAVKPAAPRGVLPSLPGASR